MMKCNNEVEPVSSVTAGGELEARPCLICEKIFKFEQDARGPKFTGCGKMAQYLFSFNHIGR